MRLTGSVFLLTFAACANTPAASNSAADVSDPARPPSDRPGYLEPERGPMMIQSPVNLITGRAEAQSGEQVILHYGKSEEKVVNLGHTIEVDLQPGNWVIEEGKRFVLKQFHFHTPSEHLLDGVTYPMEMHMVHVQEDDPGQYLVIAALFKEGETNAFIESFMDQVPEMAGSQSPAGVVDVSQICDHELGFYRYRGSLTTPPYTETVRWLVSKVIHEASAAQVGRIHRLEGDNARHIQVFGDRKLEQL